MNKKILILFFGGALFLSVAFTQTVELEPIKIDKAGPNGAVQKLSGEDYPAGGIEQSIGYSCAVNLRQPSLTGIADISLRAALFEDTAIGLSGVKLNDPQSGHYNLGLPLTAADVKTVDIYRNGQSINFNLAAPRSRGGFIKASFGEHALWEELSSINFAVKGVCSRVSVEHKSSSGARPDTDFDIYNFSFHARREKSDNTLEFLFGSTERKMGVAGLYAVSYPYQEENTNQRFFLIGAQLAGPRMSFKNKTYFRRHFDEYFLNRHNRDSFANRHITYVYGTSQQFILENGLFLSGRLRQETVDSTNLNEHGRFIQGCSLGIEKTQLGNFSVAAEGGFDYHRQYLGVVNCDLGYKNWKLSYNRTGRLPSYTELYYYSPVNIGNSGLKAQSADNFAAGVNWDFSQQVKTFAEFFLRRQYASIDWVKDNLSSPWLARNISRLTVYGADYNLGIDLSGKYFKAVSFDYTYLNLNKENPYNFSKYVFDVDRHKVVSSIKGEYLNNLFDLAAIYCRPFIREQYLTIDAALSRQWGDFTTALSPTNLFNYGFEPSQGIKAPGRWLKISLAYNF